LTAAEQEWEKSAKTNIGNATGNFSEKFLRFLPFKSNEGVFESSLNAAIDTRVQEIAKEVGCETGHAVASALLVT
jgi:hypothetical protein